MTRVLGVALVVLLSVAVGVGLAGCGCQKDIEAGTTGQIDVAKDAAAKADLMKIKTGVMSIIAETGQAPLTATQESLGTFVNPWPTNPWTNAPMAPGDAIGDYVYTPTSGVTFTLAAHLSDGSLYTAP